MTRVVAVVVAKPASGLGVRERKGSWVTPGCLASAAERTELSAAQLEEAGEEEVQVMIRYGAS